MNPNALSALFLAIFPFWFGGIWVGACFMISIIGGWKQLAIHYRRTNSISGKTYWFQSAAMRLRMTANYGSCLTITANDDGIGLSILLPWRIAHPPLFIPWPDVLASQERWLFFFKRVHLTFSMEPAVAIWISTRLAKRIQAAVGRDWFEETGDNAIGIGPLDH